MDDAENDDTFTHGCASTRKNPGVVGIENPQKTSQGYAECSAPPTHTWLESSARGVAVRSGRGCFETFAKS